MQLQHVRLDELHDRFDQCVFRIDQQGHHLGAAARPYGQRLGFFRVNAARAGREEHHAHVIGAMRQRRLERGFGLQSANLDLGAHGCRFWGRGLGRESGFVQFTMSWKFARGLIPATRRTRILMPSPACDGTSVPTPNVAGDRRLEGRSRSWVAGSGRPGASASGKTSAMAWSRWPPDGSRCDRDGSSNFRSRSGKPKYAPGTEIAARGCRKATTGP